MDTTAVTGKSKTAAPGQYLGYGVQSVRLCHHLLKVPTGCSVSLEYVDDIAIHYADGSLLLEQAKSALTGNPLSDGSFELWKTFANWASLCVEETIDPAYTKFRLYVTPAKEGGLSRLMHEAKTNENADALLAKIAKKVKPENQLKGCNPKITEFLSAGAKICRQIILNFELATEPDPLEPVRETLRIAILEESLDDFCAHVIGMGKNQIDNLIRCGDVPIINADEFRKQFQAFVRKHNFLSLLLPTTEQPAETEITQIIEAAPIFVQQLLKIGLPQEQIVRAVSDFLRSNADRINWAAGGLIVADSLDDFYDALERHFEIARAEIEDIHSGSDEEMRGRQVYRRCITHQAPLEGRAVPSHFVPGVFNILADEVRVGWHPKYNDFFGG